MSEDETPRAKSPHAFMREALGVQSRLLEQRQAFVAAALRGAQEAIDTGLGYQEHEVDRFFEAWAAQERPQRPQLRQWRE